jgi:hypothetical protein
MTQLLKSDQISTSAARTDNQIEVSFFWWSR